jgi:hypothetical protein
MNGVELSKNFTHGPLYTHYPYSYSFVTKIGRKCFFFIFWLLFNKTMCLMGQWMVSSYIMISPMVPFTLLRPYSYPLGHHGHSFVTKNGPKIVEKQVFGNSNPLDLLFYPYHSFMGQWMVSSYSRISPMVPFSLITPYSYPICHHGDSFVTKYDRNVLVFFTTITSYLTNQCV